MAAPPAQWMCVHCSETEEAEADRDVLRPASSLSAELGDDNTGLQPQGGQAVQPGLWAPFQERDVFKAAAVVRLCTVPLD